MIHQNDIDIGHFIILMVVHFDVKYLNDYMAVN
jgi:hypothetical protein